MGNKGFLNLKRRRLIGLDIDSASVRMIQLRYRHGEYTVIGAAISEIAPWDDDPDLHRTNTTQAIRQCMDTLKSNSKLTVCGLRGPEVVLRGFEFPVLLPDEIDGAVELEASQICPFSTANSVFDHQVTSNNDRKTRGFWVVATRSLIDNKQQLAYDAGLKCTLMDLDGLALLNTLEALPYEMEKSPDSSNTGHENRSVILSIGDSYTSIAISDHANRPFVRDVCTGEQDIVLELVRHTKQSPETIRAALYGYAPIEEDIQNALEKACAKLLDSIATTLRYYAAENRLMHLSKVLVCGRLALAPSFINLLSTKLSIEVVVWNPVAHLRCEADEQCETLLHEAGPTIAVAAGLAMRTI